jgi:hypothetical protein
MLQRTYDERYPSIRVDGAGWQPSGQVDRLLIKLVEKFHTGECKFDWLRPVQGIAWIDLQ